MLHDHASERHAIETDNAEQYDGDDDRMFTGPSGIPLDTFWALVDPEREPAHEE